MSYFFTNHILARCLERNIDKDLVQAVLEKPQKFYEKDDFCYFEGREIRVIARRQKNNYILITTYLINKS